MRHTSQKKSLVGITLRDAASGRVHTYRRGVLPLSVVNAVEGNKQSVSVIGSFVVVTVLAVVASVARVLEADGWVFVAHTGAFWSRLFDALFLS